MYVLLWPIMYEWLIPTYIPQDPIPHMSKPYVFHVQNYVGQWPDLKKHLLCDTTTYCTWNMEQKTKTLSEKWLRIKMMLQLPKHWWIYLDVLYGSCSPPYYKKRLCFLSAVWKRWNHFSSTWTITSIIYWNFQWTT